MNRVNYGKILTGNPDLAPCIVGSIGPCGLRSGRSGVHRDFDNIEAWIESQVAYVAIRPFESLDLASSSEATPDYRTRPFKTRQYTVWFHIEGEERAFSRAKGTELEGFPLTDEPPATTVESVLRWIAQWHAEGWAKQPGKRLVIDAITCVRTITQRGETYPQESLDVYRPPADILERLTKIAA